MIYKNRTWFVGNKKIGGFPFKFHVEYNKNLEETILAKGFFFKETFSMEELEDMIAILKKLNKETREQLI